MKLVKLAKNQLVHIDNNFFHLTDSQARAIAVEGKLPAAGRARKADPTKLAGFDFGKLTGDPVRFQSFHLKVKAEELGECWVQQTGLSFFNGEPVKNRVVWAVYRRFSR